MKIGDYVRTKIGISKCIKVIPIRENSFMYEFDREVYEDVAYLTASELDKYKSSSNILDLIEVGDYVNGYLVLDIAYSPTKAIYLLEKDNHFALIPRMNKDIKSIVTKEQFEEMEYIL